MRLSVFSRALLVSGVLFTVEAFSQPLAPGEAAATSAAVASPPALPAQEALWCWTALKGDLGPQDTSLVWVQPTLAAHGAEHLALAWEEEGLMRLRRWTGSGWEPIPSPVKEERFVAYAPVLRFDATGAPVLAWFARFSHSRRALHVARWEGTQWVALGEPLGARTGSDAELSEPSMVLDPHGNPVVLWRETHDYTVSSLHVARWTGSTWEPLGRGVASGLRSYQRVSALAVDARGAPWVAWTSGPENKSFIRVARWNGKAWEDVGATRRGLLRRTGRASEPELLTEGDEALLAWLEPTGPHSEGTQLARWTGKGWTPLAAPLAVPGSEASLGRPAFALLADGSLVAARSERNFTGLTHAYVQQLTPGGWRWLFRGLHFDEGQSFTEELRLAATPDGGFSALLDEPGDHQRLRLFHARPCAPDEQPAPLPAMRTLASFWPSTVDEAVERLVSRLDEESKRKVRETPRDKLSQFHLGWGMGIRNSYGLWAGNSRLLESCGPENLHPDSCSMRIIERVWERLQPRQPEPAPDAGP